MLAFSMIAYSGEAADYYMQALHARNENNNSKIEELLKKGDESLHKAHTQQMDLIVKEANADDVPYSLVMVHAQDHLMNAIIIKNLVVELLHVYEYVDKTNRHD